MTAATATARWRMAAVGAGALLAGVLAGVLAVGLAARPAGAVGGERVTRFDATLAIAADGSLTVTERIAYDFGASVRHGIFRFLPDRFACTGAAVGPSCPAGHDRVTPVDGVTATADGRSTPVHRTRQGNTTVLRLGDAASTVVGAHVYELRYRVRGVLNPDGDGAVLPWNVTGNGWTVPLDAVTATVTAPATPTATACTWGPPGASAVCGEVTPLAVRDLAPGDGMTVTVRLPAGTVTGTAPVLEVRQTIGRAFSLNGGSAALTGLTALAGGAAAWAVGRRGRDRRFVGGDVEVAMGRAGQADEPRPLRGRLPDVMEFAPPNGIRPGQLGALLDEKVDGRDVTATIVDLAVRGHLRLDELAGDDWRITRTTARTPDGLLPFEQLLLTELLGGADAVTLGSLRRAWAASFAKVRHALYDDLVASGWYRSRPDRSRAGAVALGVLLTLAGLAVTVALGQRTTVALAGIPVVLAGLVTLVTARRAGARTATGTAMAARGSGFKRLVETPTQQEMARFAERHDVFVEYLPYAIVFGCATAWAHRFAALGALPPATAGWYVPMVGVGHPGDDAWDRIASGVAGFATSASASLSAPAVSASSSGGSSGGFSSGGGFGGGGGGSW